MGGIRPNHEENGIYSSRATIDDDDSCILLVSIEHRKELPSTDDRVMLMFMVTAATSLLRGEPPGPPSLPPILSNGLGSLPLIGLGKAVGIGPPPHERMHQLADQYGEVMTLQMGREPWVILSSPETVYEAFVVKGADFSGRPMVPSMSISSGKGKGFAKSTLDPGLVKLRQKAFGDLFDAKSVSRSNSHFEAEIKLLAEYLASESDSSKSGSVEIRPALRRAVTNMVLRYAFSSRVPYHGEEPPNNSSDGTEWSSSPLFTELVDVVEQLWEELTSTQTFLTDLVTDPRVADAFYTGVSPIPSLVKKRDSLIRQIVSQRRQERVSKPTESKDMLDILLEASLPESDVMYTLVDLFVAGVNTVSTTLEWMLLLTANEPYYQTRARSDAWVDYELERKSQTESSNMDKPKGESQSSYVDALIKETLRFKPPLLLPRRSTVASSIGNHYIPAGRIIMANNWALTHDEAWWDSPYTFRPERWLEEEDKAFAGAESCKFIPYSIGKRACPGSRLAQEELKVATSVLLRSLSWSPAESRIDLREDYSLTLSPTKSQSLRFHRLHSADRIRNKI